MSLKTKMSIAVSLLVAILISASALLIIWRFEKQFKEIIAAQQFSMVTEMAEDIESKIADARQGLLSVAEQIPLQAADHPEMAQQILDDHTALKTIFDDNLVLFTKEGKPIAATTHKPGQRSIELSSRNYIKTVAATRRPSISAPYLADAASRRPAIMLTVPILDNKGEVAAILAGSLDLSKDNFLGKLARFKIGKTGYYYLYDTDRTIIMHPDPNWIMMRNKLPGVNRLFDKGISGFDGTEETVNSRGVRLLSSVRHIKATNWIIAANFPVSEAYAPLKNAHKYALAAVVGGVALSIAFVWLSMTYLTAPLLRFTSHIRGLSGREGEERQIVIDTHDEVEELGRAFNAMMANLETNQQELRQAIFHAKTARSKTDAIIAAIGDGISILDKDFKILYQNQVFESFAGRHPGELCYQAYYGREAICENCPVEMSFRDGNIHTAEQMINKYGEPRYLEITASPLLDADGTIIAGIEVARDISSRKLAEQRIVRINRLYNILSKMNEAIVRIREPLGLYQEVCRIAVEDGSLRMAWLGMVDPETLNVVPIVHYGFENGYLDHISISLDPNRPEGNGPTGKALREKRYFINNDTENNPAMAPWRAECLKRGYLSSCSFPLLSGGEVTGAIAFYAQESDYFHAEEIHLLSTLADDLSLGIEFMKSEAELKLADEALKREKEFLSNMLQDSAIATFVLDPQHRVLFWNRTCETLTGVKAEDVIGTSRHWQPFYDHERPCLADLAIDESLPGPDQLYRQYALSSLVHEGLQAEGHFPNLNGMARCILFDAAPIRSSSGQLLGAIETMLDITEQKKLEAQLFHAQKMEAIGQLAGGIAHDFNNILTAIIGFTSLMEMQLESGDPHRTNVNQILAAADRAADLTRSLLAFSRKQVINPKPVDLNHIIAKTEKFLQRIIGEDIELTTSLNQEQLTVNADVGQIEQVLMNLATNARDAMADGGMLSIETRLMEMGNDFIQAHGYGRLGRYALVSVTDTGVGMDENIRKKLFEPFFTTKEAGKGTGLGMSIVYGIIKQHDGYINIYSEPGMGTTFTIYLPLLDADIETTMTVTDKALQGGVETVLVADDDALLRELSEKVLSQFGYTVITAQDGQDAVDRFRENGGDISLAILDVIMPRKNGRDAFDEIRKIRPDCKVIFISGYTAEIIQKRGMFDKNLEYVAKPLSPTKLLAKVREVLDRT